MGIFERLGNVIKSYINDEDSRPAGRRSGAACADPDLEAAYDELNDYLDNGERSGRHGGGEGAAAESAGDTGEDPGKTPRVPEELRADFAELGVPFGADRKTCREAYKKLLKLHHPDRHAGHEGNMKKATEKTARINAAYARIEKLRKNRAANFSPGPADNKA
jgi:hypothetical protein